MKGHTTNAPKPAPLGPGAGLQFSAVSDATTIPVAKPTPVVPPAIQPAGKPQAGADPSVAELPAIPPQASVAEPLEDVERGG